MMEEVKKQIKAKENYVDDLCWRFKALNEAKAEFRKKKNQVWIETDFAKLGYTNDKQRTAYVESLLEEERNNIAVHERMVEALKLFINTADDKIRCEMFEAEIRARYSGVKFD